MALQKEILTKFGITGNYWKINELTVNVMNKTYAIVVSLYKDQDTRNLIPTPQPLEIKFFYQNILNPFAFSKSGIDLTEATTILSKQDPVKIIEAVDSVAYLTIAYKELKKDSFFIDALDV